MNAFRKVVCLLLTVMLLAGMASVSMAAPQEGHGVLPAAADADTVTLDRAGLEAVFAGDAELLFTGEIQVPAVGGTDSPFLPYAGPEGAGRTVYGYSEDYYGSQLSSAGAAIYSAIRRSALWNGPTTEQTELLTILPEDMKTPSGHVVATGTGSAYELRCDWEQGPYSDAAFAAAAALVFDHPELSWLVHTDYRVVYAYTAPELTDADRAALRSLGPGETYELQSRSIPLSSFVFQLTDKGYREATTAPEQITAADRYDYADTKDRAAIEAALQQAKAEIGTLAGKTDWQKAESLHDWLCGHAEYADTTGARFLNGWRGYQTAWSALVEGVTVCAGYAKTMKLLCDAYGIPCVIVCGWSHGESHAWNYVQLEGSWYGVDATWADQDWGISRADYLKGSAGFLSDHSEGSLSGSHNFVYPELSAADFDPAGLPEPTTLSLDVLNAAGQILAPGSELEPDEKITVRITAAGPASGTVITGNLSAQVPNTGSMMTLSPFTVSSGSSIEVQLNAGQLLHTLILTNVSPAGTVLDPGSWYGTVRPASPAAATLSLEVLDDSGRPLPSGTELAEGTAIRIRITASGLQPDAAVTGNLSALDPTCGYILILSPFTISGDGNIEWLLDAGQLPSSFTLDLTDVSPAGTALSPDPWSGTVRPMQQPTQPAALNLQLKDAAGQTVAPGSTLKFGDKVTAVIMASGMQTGQIVTGELALTGLTGPGGTAAGTSLVITEDGTVDVPLQVQSGASLLSVSVGSLQPDGTTCSPASWSGRAEASPQPSPADPDRPEERPAPEVTAPAGYEAGRVNGRTYSSKTAGAKVNIYMPNSAGKMVRVAVPYVTGEHGERYYPISVGGETLFPRLKNGKLECYCRYKDSWEIPVLKPAGGMPQASSGLQTGQVNGRPYNLEASGAKIKVYLQSSAGKMVRVAVPYQTAGSARYYPVSVGGAPLAPVIQNGRLVSYNACTESGGGAVLVPIS